MRVWIDGKLLIDQWNRQAEGSESNVQEHTGNKAVSNIIKLTAGKKHAIKVEYFEDNLNASVVLLWQSKSQKREVVPAEAFSVATPATAQQGLNAVYRSLMPHICYTTNNGALYAIALEWNDEKLVLNIAEPAAGTKINMLGRKGDLPWKYVNHQLIVDVSGIKVSEIPCRSAWVFRIL